MSTQGQTIRLHRVLKAPTARVYRAFLDPHALAQWLPPFGFTAQVHEMNPVVGGSFKMSFTNFTNEASHSFGGTYLELIPGQLVRYTNVFDDPNLPGSILVTVQLKEVMVGTEMSIVQDYVPSLIPAEMCYLGWQESLIKLAQLVEPEINA